MWTRKSLTKELGTTLAYPLYFPKLKISSLVHIIFNIFYVSFTIFFGFEKIVKDIIENKVKGLRMYCTSHKIWL